MTESKETTKTEEPEEDEDDLMNREEKRKKARLRTRGPYRQASTKNLPDTS